MSASPTPNADASAADRRYVFHSWSAQAEISPLPVAGGDGAWFWDDQGTRYLDFSSQLVNLNLGHQHPDLVAAIREQADTLCTIAPSFANAARTEAARLILEHAPRSETVRPRSVFFTNSGAEAVENALRLARLHTGRHKILTAYRSYHGATAGAITATGEARRWRSEPGIPGVVHFFGPFTYRSAFDARSDDQEAARALAHLAEVVQMEGPHTVAAIMLESVVGANGVIVPPDGYMQGVRELCDRHGIVMICDEVMVGFGRTGTWFAIDHWDVAPDLITFAKGVNSGYVPLGGVILSEAIAADFDHDAYPGGLTYSGHPLACAAAVASINVFERDGMVDRAARLGHEVLGPTLAEIATRHPSVGEVRGMGCFWAIELVRDPDTREPLVALPGTPASPDSDAGAAAMSAVVAACRAGGVWPIQTANRLHIAPPLVIDPDDLRRGLEVIDTALDPADNALRAS